MQRITPALPILSVINPCFEHKKITDGGKTVVSLKILILATLKNALNGF